MSLLILSALLSGISFTSCNSGELNDKAEATADNFYKDLQEKRYDSALALCSPKAFVDDSKESWTKGLEKNAGILGNITSFKKLSGFNIQSSTSVGTTVTVVYDVNWQYGKSQDSLIMIKEKDGSMKVYSYRWNHKTASYLTEMNASEKQADEYMSAIKSGNFDAAINLCSEVALQITPRENWKQFFNTATAKLGTMSGYKIVADSTRFNISSNGASGKGNYYDVFVKTDRANNGKVLEKIVFFQKSYDDPLKLVGHFFL